MKSQITPLMDFLVNCKENLTVPLYQRNYDWTLEQLAVLLKDIREAGLRGKDHFVGSLFFVEDLQGGEAILDVLDGQQRLTTLMLLLAALSRADPEFQMRGKDALYHRNPKGEHTMPRFVPVDLWATTYQKILDGIPRLPEDNMAKNYRYLEKQVKLRPKEVEKGLEHLVCNILTITSEEEPQKIFETLNATGVNLTEGDKVRNFLFMNSTRKEQRIFYQNYWQELEKAVDWDMTGFLQDYLVLFSEENPEKKQVARKFQDYVRTGGFKKQELFSHLLKIGERYKQLLHPEIAPPALGPTLTRLNILGTSVAYPYAMELLGLLETGKLKESDVAEAFEILENWFFRRMITSQNTPSRDFLVKVHFTIKNYDGTLENYPEKLKYALLSHTKSYRIPGEREFLQGLTTRDLYRGKQKNAKYLLERLENHGTRETRDIYGGYEKDIYTIEHIMPQNLSPQWKEDLGENWEHIHKTWLHRVANLTLTGYNTGYSNRSFYEKTTMDHGFAQSPITLNRWIGRQPKWTLKELEERNEWILHTAKEIWPEITTDYAPPEKVTQEAALGEREALIGKIPLDYTFQGQKTYCDNWLAVVQSLSTVLGTKEKGTNNSQKAVEKLEKLFEEKGIPKDSLLITVKENPLWKFWVAVVKELAPIFGERFKNDIPESQ